MHADRDPLIAYLATLGALIAVFVAALAFGAISAAVVGKMEAFGLGTVTGGLIGVLRIPQARSVRVDNPPSDPVNTSDKDAKGDENAIS